jgi:hypothetical protein
LDVIHFIYFRCRLYNMYNLHYVPTTLGVQSWREIISGGTQTKKVEYHWSTGLNRNSLTTSQSSFRDSLEPAWNLTMKIDLLFFFFRHHKISTIANQYRTYVKHEYLLGVYFSKIVAKWNWRKIFHTKIYLTLMCCEQTVACISLPVTLSTPWAKNFYETLPGVPTYSLNSPFTRLTSDA